MFFKPGPVVIFLKALQKLNQFLFYHKKNCRQSYQNKKEEQLMDVPLSISQVMVLLFDAAPVLTAFNTI